MNLSQMKPGEFGKAVRRAADHADRERRAVETVRAMDFTAELERMRSALFDAFAAELAALQTKVGELRAEVARLRDGGED
jgi:hypothetical protein